jgi:tetratricopeptide (TPR) repeat protein
MKHLVFLLMLFPLISMAQNNFKRAEIYFQQEKFSKAKPIFEAYLKENPMDQKTLEYLGDIAGYAKEWDVSRGYYKDLLKTDYNNANYNFKYGAVLGMKALNVNKFRALTYISDIKESFEKAAQLDPKHIDVRWALIEFYIQLPGIIGGSESKAISYADELEKISPVDGFLAKGYIAEYSGRVKDAELFYKKAITVGGSTHTYEKLSNFYEKNNQPGEAIKTSSEALRIHKRNQLNYQIGKIAAQYNLDAELGISCLQEYIKNHSVRDGVPKDWAYYRLAQIYKNQGNKESALQWIDKALLDRPDFEEARKERKIILGL